jgi:hypothetical protein
MKTWFLFLLVFVLAAPNISSNGQGSHILFSPTTPVFGQTVSYAWNGGGDDVLFNVQCFVGGTNVLMGGGSVMEDGVPRPLPIQMGPTSNWSSGGADCTIQADIFSYSGGSGNYQRKFAYASYTVLP